MFNHSLMNLQDLKLPLIETYQWAYYFDWLKGCIFANALLIFIAFLNIVYLQKTLINLKCWSSSLIILFNKFIIFEPHLNSIIVCFCICQYFTNNPNPYISHIEKTIMVSHLSWQNIRVFLIDMCYFVKKDLLLF